SSWANHPFFCRGDDLDAWPNSLKLSESLLSVLPNSNDQKSIRPLINSPFLTICTQSRTGHPCFHFDLTSLLKLGTAQASISPTLPVQTKISAFPPAAQNSWCQRICDGQICLDT